jgi:hypothetical protein
MKASMMPIGSTVRDEPAKASATPSDVPMAATGGLAIARCGFLIPQPPRERQKKRLWIQSWLLGWLRLILASVWQDICTDHEPKDEEANHNRY